MPNELKRIRTESIARTFVIKPNQVHFCPSGNTIPPLVLMGFKTWVLSGCAHTRSSVNVNSQQRRKPSRKLCSFPQDLPSSLYIGPAAPKIRRFEDRLRGLQQFPLGKGRVQNICRTSHRAVPNTADSFLKKKIHPLSDPRATTLLYIFSLL